jgi:hypothetical protein
MVRAFRELGHEVIEAPKSRFKRDDNYNLFDILIDIDCGRDLSGNNHFHLHDGPVPIPSVAFLIDTHGNPDLHQRISRHADHVFFAVWDKRDLFTDHPSAHWAPNFTDLNFFDKMKYNEVTPNIDFGFFGTKGGQDRANKMIEYCKANDWTYDVDEIGRKGKHRWPETARRMAHCRWLFNHGQKHDDPNLRVMESMAMGKPLITGTDIRSGMGYLFEPWQHYIPYEAYSYEGLLDRMKWVNNKPEAAKKIAMQAYEEVCKNHLTEHRVNQILEVVNAR